MTLAEEGERGVIEALVCRDDPESDVFHQSARDPSRGVLADAVGVDEHGEHEGGVIGDATATVLAVFAIERREIELGHHVENEEGEVIVRQSISNRERQQEELVPVHLAQIDRQAPSFRARETRAGPSGFMQQPPRTLFPGSLTPPTRGPGSGPDRT